MPSCEKCWDDAYTMSLSSSKDLSECYRKIVDERFDNPCTPEEQAGQDATICPKCNRRTLHQYVRICMNTKCDGE